MQSTLVRRDTWIERPTPRPRRFEPVRSLRDRDVWGRGDRGWRSCLARPPAHGLASLRDGQPDHRRVLSAVDTDLGVPKARLLKNRAQANPEGSQPLGGG